MKKVMRIATAAKCNRLICLVLAALTAAAVLLPASIFVVNAAQKALTIPDPADYFGKVSEHENKERYHAYNFTGFSSFPAAKVKSYYNELKKLGLTTKDKESESVIDFDYNGKSAVQITWDSKRGKIRVNVVRPLTVGAASGNTSVTGTGTADSGTFSFPSPEDYFGDIDEIGSGSSSTVYYFKGFKSYPESKMNSYVNAMKKAGFTGGKVEKDSNGDRVVTFHYDGNWAASMRWYKKEQYLWFNVSSKLVNSFVSQSQEDTGNEKPSDPQPQENIDNGKPSVLSLLEDCFGSYKRAAYDSEADISRLWFSGPTDFPEKKFEKLKKYVESKGMKFFLHDSRAAKEMTVYHDVGGSLLVGEWHKVSGEIRIDIRWKYIGESGHFNAAEASRISVTNPKNGPSVINLLEDCFGSCKKKSYDEKNYRTTLSFAGSADFPEKRFEKLKKYVESNGMTFSLSDFRSKKEISVYYGVGGGLLYGEWNKESGEIKMEINWEYIKKSVFFDSDEIPPEPAEVKDPDPVPGKIDCPDCNNGSCNTCGGDGEVDGYMPGIRGKQENIKTCSDCHGGTCKRCYGNGKIDG